MFQAANKAHLEVTSSRLTWQQGIFGGNWCCLRPRTAGEINLDQGASLSRPRPKSALLRNVAIFMFQEITVLAQFRRTSMLVSLCY